MNIVMMTNTFTPHVGGVSRSVTAFTDEFRKAGHDVLVVAPEFDNMPEHERDVVRVPAIRNFNGSDFSVRIPIPFLLSERLEKFEPDVIHSHHPFLLGDTALVVAEDFNIPVVFTHHTMYEQYTHYVPGDSKLMKRFVIELGTGYANLCDHVIAPSESIRDILVQRGVTIPIEVIPTGVDYKHFREGDGNTVRKELGIPQGHVVIGHLGRLAPEKNLEFLSIALVDYMEKNLNTDFVVFGEGPSKDLIKSVFRHHDMEQRVYFGGVVTGRKVADAYHSMDVFVFASKTETQGMVLTEAMASGVPVIALDAPGAREVVKDRMNGCLVNNESPADFADALEWVLGRPGSELLQLKNYCSELAKEYSIENCAKRCLGLYQKDLTVSPKTERLEGLREITAMIDEHWKIWLNRMRAFSGAVMNRSGP